MKKLSVLAALAIAVVAAAFSFSTMNLSPSTKPDKSGHVLTALWKSYDDATKADKPRTRMEILEKIKAQSTAGRYHVDFYDAATLYAEIGASRNWKLRDSLNAALDKEIQAYNEPVVTFVYRDRVKYAGGKTLFDLAEGNKEALVAGHTEAFYSNTSSLFDGVVTNNISDDYEYALWRALQKNNLNSETQKALTDYLGDRYPSAPLLEYYILNASYSSSYVIELKRKFLSKYDGKAVALFAEASLLSHEFDSLGKAKASSDQYKAFYDKLGKFEKKRASFKGDEKTIADQVLTAKNLRGRLTASSVSVDIVDGQGYVIMQNMSQARVRLSYGAGVTIFDKVVKNPVKSFYTVDRVPVDLPLVDDGNYDFVALEKGDPVSRMGYERYTISFAKRQTSEGTTVYATDYKTGEPLEKVNVVFMRKGEKAASAEVVLSGGFALLPQKLEKLLQSGDSYDIYAEFTENGHLRRSQEVYTYKRTWFGSETEIGDWCLLMRDRGAYNPGDELKYKVVLFGGDKIRELSVKPSETLTVKFFNSENKELAEQTLVTGEFGSASGTFAIPKDQRGGIFSMKVIYGSKTLTTDGFRVDEFVLPTFQLTFDMRDELVLPGDAAIVSGKVESYSGHSLGDADVRCIVSRYGSAVLLKEVELGEDGSFKLEFPIENSGYYSIALIVTDATGETQEFYQYRYVPDSLNITFDVANSADASFSFPPESEFNCSAAQLWKKVSTDDYVVTDEVADIKISVRTDSPLPAPMDVRYEIFNEDSTVVREGICRSGVAQKISMKDWPSGIYTLKASASATSANGKVYERTRYSRIMKVAPEDKTLGTKVRSLFISGPLEITQGDAVTFRLGSTDGKIWAVATLFGEKYRVLENRNLILAQGEIYDGMFEYKDSYPDAVRLQVFYFHGGRAYSYEREYSRVRSTLDMPLEFSTFEDRTLPGTQYTFSLKTGPGAEALVAIFDKSLDAIARNVWETVRLSSFHIASPNIGYVVGKDGNAFEKYIMHDEEMMLLASPAEVGGAVVMKSRAVNAVAEMADMEMATADSADDTGSGEEDAQVSLREVFATALAFEPHLVSNEKGELSFSFKTSDKLSTYHVAVFAHDKSMRNGTMTRDMMVTIPLKVALVEPRTLYVGDNYDASVAISSISDKPMTGQLTVSVYPSDKYEDVKPFFTTKKSVTVPARGQVQVSVPVEIKAPNEDKIAIKAVFVSGKTSDGVVIPVKVLPSQQVLTESHSAVLRPGADKEALIRSLRGRFVNVPGSAAAVREISVRDMVLEAIPDKVDPQGSDVLSLTEALYVRYLAGLLGATVDESVIATSEIVAKIAECRNADGGYGWFPGFHSSQVITGEVLERFALMRARGFDIPSVESAVRYLDDSRFSSELPYWCGWLGSDQYMYVRSMYPEVPFKPEPTGDKAVTRKNLSEFKKYAREYLVPTKAEGRGLEGRILAKVRRVLTLRNLAATPEGLALAKAWDVTGLSDKKLQQSIRADYESLVEYAIEHRDGGWYYPNAVMPLRGLMENEAYAHALICRLMSSISKEEGLRPAPSDIATGIRLWLMIQKETQNWTARPEFVEAIDEITKDPWTMETKVVALSGTFKIPFKDIKASGNGFTLNRSMAVERPGEGSFEVSGDTPVQLRLGDKVTVRYEIWSQENRSFVLLTAPREGALVPVDQLSGHYGWRFRPFYIGGWYSFSPQGYREVKAADSRYYFDSFPEEKTVIEEEFFVSQAGTYTAPVPVVESLYAPHYRANSAFTGAVSVERK